MTRRACDALILASPGRIRWQEDAEGHRPDGCPVQSGTFVGSVAPDASRRLKTHVATGRPGWRACGDQRQEGRR